VSYQPAGIDGCFQVRRFFWGVLYWENAGPTVLSRALQSAAPASKPPNVSTTHEAHLQQCSRTRRGTKRGAKSQGLTPHSLKLQGRCTATRGRYNYRALQAVHA
jgi:hypothetical protein